MSQTIFPNSQRAIPKTGTERAEAEQASEGTWVRVEDPKDPPGEEMMKGARVWKRYVSETDRWDKELVEGRNSSLDVLLTISTAFIIESLGDLQPDPAETSAKALLAISQKLDAIITGQPPISLPTQDSNVDDFTPSRSAVVVNILWLLSLSLSVAVSLIAILSKEWCYKFMSGRSGAIYDQARKRQKRWNGIERWKMQEVLNHLPGLMHSALVLFAVGLCIHLWDINISVAIPVTVVTSISGLIYVVTTVLPIFDRFCPYSTPATLLLNYIGRHFKTFVLRPIVCNVMLAVRNEYHRIIHPDWLESFLQSLLAVLDNMYNDESEEGENDDSEEKGNMNAHMDVVTSQMLAWMIDNCEDPRSVDIALRAISGARLALPIAPLQECRALRLVYRRIHSFIRFDTGLMGYKLKAENIPQEVLVYCRSFSILIRGDMLHQRITIDLIRIIKSHVRYELLDSGASCKTQISSSQHAFVRLFDGEESAATDPKVLELAVNAASCLLYCTQDWSAFLLIEPLSIEPVISWASSVLREYANGNAPCLSVPALIMLLESLAYYMIQYWPTKKDAGESPIPALLVRIYLQTCDTIPDVARVVGINLAATAFGVNSYPGGEHPSNSIEDKGKRAIQALQYWHANTAKVRPKELFMFGLVGLLPHINLCDLKSDSNLMSNLYDQVMSMMGYSDEFSRMVRVSKSYTQTVHFTTSYQNIYPQTTESLELPVVSSRSTAFFCFFLRAGFACHELLVPALVIASYAQTNELQDSCIQVLASAPIAREQSHVAAVLKSNDVSRVPFNPQRAANEFIAEVTMFYFRLLVGNIMLCNNSALTSRQYFLRYVLDNHDLFKSLKPTIENGSLPGDERILEHVAEHIGVQPLSECMRGTTQLIVDFCHARDDKNLTQAPVPTDPEEVPGWVTKLQAIKDNFKPRRPEVIPHERIGEGEPGTIAVVDATEGEIENEEIEVRDQAEGV